MGFKDSLLVIDCNNLAHRANHVTGELMYKGMPTGILFGFMSQLLFITKKVRPSNYIFAWDSDTYFRRDIYPAYKNKSLKKLGDPADLDMMYSQFNALCDSIIPALGFVNSWKIKGYEADDIIAGVCRDMKHEPVTIASSDDDLLQLLSKTTRIYNVAKKAFYGMGDFFDDYGIPPNKWAEVKAIAGCSGDNVTGIDQVGVKRAVDYLKGELKKTYKAYQNIECEEGQKIIKENRPVVTLPYDDIDIPDIKPTEFDYNTFLSICDKYGFKKWLVDDDWRLYFNI